MNRNMLTRRLGASLLVLRQNKNDATEEDWNDFLQFLSHNRGQLEQLRLLVLTDGGIPTAAQRKRLAETLGSTQMLVAAVSDNMKVRFSGATIALFVRNYRQFSIAEMDRAYAHLRMTPQEQAQARIAFEELNAQLIAVNRR